MKVASFQAIEPEFIARAHTMVWCSVATQDTRGRLRSRILHPLWSQSVGWSFTRLKSPKTKHFLHQPFTSLAYVSDVVRPAYADCVADYVYDLAIKQRLWDAFKAEPAPLGFDFGRIFSGVDDHDCLLIRFTPWRIELGNMAEPDLRRVWRRDSAPR